MPLPVLRHVSEACRRQTRQTSAQKERIVSALPLCKGNRAAGSGTHLSGKCDVDLFVLLSHIFVDLRFF